MEESLVPHNNHTGGLHHSIWSPVYLSQHQKPTIQHTTKFGGHTTHHPEPAITYRVPRKASLTLQ
jgi:hypothetical protein